MRLVSKLASRDGVCLPADNTRAGQQQNEATPFVENSVEQPYSQSALCPLGCPAETSEPRFTVMLSQALQSDAFAITIQIPDGRSDQPSQGKGTQQPPAGC
jgi:hypothetical protein